jgi:hypothetical protein
VAVLSFSSEDEIAMTVAPDATANWSANLIHRIKNGGINILRVYLSRVQDSYVDFPPVPWIKTVSPALSGS